MNFDEHIRNVISRNSKDRDIGEAITYFVELLQKLDIDFIVIGSTAIQTYMPYFRRIPHDFDITLPESQILKIERHAETDDLLRFEVNDLACKLFFKNITYMHLIPERMNYLDKISNKVFTTFRVHHRDRRQIREIRFINYNARINVYVPIVEYSFCLNMLPTLDTNTFSDNLFIVEKYDLDLSLIKEFANRVPEVSAILTHRLELFKRKTLTVRKDLTAKIPSLA